MISKKSEQSLFSVPIGLIFFKRKESTLQVFEQIRKIKPKKLYLISDEGRNDEEKEMVLEIRTRILELCDWGGEIIKLFADENRGVYVQIGEITKNILNKEGKAIFLEDDNLPALSFFTYCAELLDKYENEEKVLWICGTNYMKDSTNDLKTSYAFTQQLLPCGWASWGWKFSKYYDGKLGFFDYPNHKKIISKRYKNKKLFKQQYTAAKKEYLRAKKNKRISSWDFQMIAALKYHDLLGITPVFNQIKNIGADLHSTHGGTTMKNVMTRRFCEIDVGELDFPLIHPTEINVDPSYEKKIEKIILFPFYLRFKFLISSLLKKILRIPMEDSLLNRRKKH